MSDETLKVIYRHSQLQELYFQCYERTYRLEKAKRELDILTGKSKIRPNAYLNEEYDINDTNHRFMNKYFGPGKLATNITDTLADSSTYWFRNCSIKPRDEKPHRSFLYEPEYPECTCGFQNRFWNNCQGNYNYLSNKFLGNLVDLFRDS